MGVITKPLKQLTDASQRLADADYDVDLNYHGRNEIGTLTGAFTRMRDQIRRSIADLNHQIYHDRLTDLPNMRHFFTLAEEPGSGMLAEGRQPVMLYFDIVGLKNYNRQYGFEKGDRLIAGLRRDTLAAVRRPPGLPLQRRPLRGGDGRGPRGGRASRRCFRECETAMDGKRLPIRVGVYPRNALESGGRQRRL